MGGKLYDVVGTASLAVAGTALVRAHSRNDWISSARVVDSGTVWDKRVQKRLSRELLLFGICGVQPALDGGIDLGSGVVLRGGGDLVEVEV